MTRNDLPGDAAAPIHAFDLEQQALPEIARSHAGGIERLHHMQRRFHLLEFVLACLRDLLQRCREIPVFVQVPDDGFGGIADVVVNQADAQLRAQMVAEGHGRR